MTMVVILVTMVITVVVMVTMVLATVVGWCRGGNGGGSGDDGTGCSDSTSDDYYGNLIKIMLKRLKRSNSSVKSY